MDDPASPWITSPAPCNLRCPPRDPPGLGTSVTRRQGGRLRLTAAERHRDFMMPRRRFSPSTWLFVSWRPVRANKTVGRMAENHKSVTVRSTCYMLRVPMIPSKVRTYALPSFRLSIFFSCLRIEVESLGVMMTSAKMEMSSFLERPRWDFLGYELRDSHVRKSDVGMKVTMGHTEESRPWKGKLIQLHASLGCPCGLRSVPPARILVAVVSSTGRAWALCGH